MSTETFVRAAEGIGDRLLRGAAWSGDACTWCITVPNSSKPGATMSAITGGSLYQGTAGIALFLAELWTKTSDPRLLRTIRGAMQLGVSEGERASSASIGLYSGTTGVIYVAARLAVLTGDDYWASVATRVFESLPVVPPERHPSDIIAGAAGAVLALLRVHALLGDNRVLDRAVAYGGHCARLATRHPFGWSWASPGLFVRQDLCGYAHGASGYAHAFLELFVRTGDMRWQHCAVRALQYERFQGGPALGRWWDFRQPALTNLSTRLGGMEFVRELIERGEFELPSGLSSMRAWCHGSPGAAVVRARATSLGVDAEECAREANAAIDATAEHLFIESGGFSLCHGTCGNADALFVGCELIGRQEPQQVIELMLTAIDRYKFDTEPWPSGIMGSSFEPSLMLGEAGIGHFLLRIADPSIPSALFLSDWRPGPAQVSGDIATLRGDEATGAFAYLAAASAAFSPSSAQSSLRSLFENSTTIASCLETIERGPVSQLPDVVRDALAVDSARLRAEMAHDDYTPTFLTAARQRAMAPAVNHDRRFLAAPACTVLTTEYAWDSWLLGSHEQPPRRPSYLLVFRNGRSIRSQFVSGGLARLLQYLRVARTMMEIVTHMESGVVDALHSTATIRGFVHEALESSLQAGIVVEYQEAR